jgi:hypothetical protein
MQTQELEKQTWPNIVPEMLWGGTWDEGWQAGGTEWAGSGTEWAGSGTEWAGSGTEWAGSGTEWAGSGTEWAVSGTEWDSSGTDWDRSGTDWDSRGIDCSGMEPKSRSAWLSLWRARKIPLSLPLLTLTDIASFERAPLRSPQAASHSRKIKIRGLWKVCSACGPFASGLSASWAGALGSKEVGGYGVSFMNHKVVLCAT